MGDYNATKHNLTTRNYVNDWINVNVNNEVLRGQKLREHKSITYSAPIKTYDVVELEYENPFCVEHQVYHKKAVKRNRPRKGYSSQSNPCTPRSNSRASSPARTYITVPPNMFSKSSTKSMQSNGGSRKCSLRIAELAMPSKRHCLETWKTKSHSLPGFMIERLKQHVMDQIPVAKIPDAISCFKRKCHPSKNRSSSKRPGSSSRKSAKYNDRCMMEIRKFCIIFGHQIAQRMYNRQNLKLTPELDRLSLIVAGELQNILKNPKLVVAGDNNRALLKEMSTKVAVWIHSVLENAAEKILEEELMDKKRNERETLNEHCRVTVVQRHLSIKHEELTELEEEEGPILDFLEDVMERVVRNCIPSPVNERTSEIYEQDSLQREHSISKGEMNETDSDNYSFLGGQDSEQNSIGFNEDDIGDQLKNDLYNRLDEIIVEERPSDDTESNKEQKRASDDTESNKELPSKELIEGLEEENVEIRGNEEQIKKILNDIVDENVSEVFVVLTEEPFDERNKTVKFSNVDNVARNSRGIKFRNRQRSPDNRLSQNLQIVPYPLENRPDLVFAPANENLLSDADEPWPDELPTPILKICESVSKSVTSLGRIDEGEEKHSFNTIPEKCVETYLDATEELIYRSYLDKPSQELVAASLTDIEDGGIPLLSASSNITIESFHPIKVEIRKSDSLPNETNFSMSESDKKNLKEKQTETIIEDKATKTLLERIHEEFRKAKLEQLTANTGKLYQLNQGEEQPKSNEESRAVLTDQMISEKEIARHDLELDKNTGFSITELNHPIEGQKLDKVKKSETVAGSDSFKGSGKGDHRDTDAEIDVISEAIKKKIKYTPARSTKFDYKVHPQTAPAWAVVPACQSSDDSFSNIIWKRIPPQKNLQYNDLHKWCNDLDRTVVNLQQWNAWVEKTCKKMLYLKSKTEMTRLLDPCDKTSALHDWVKYKKNIDKEAILWRKLKLRTKQVLQNYNFKDRAQPKPKPKCDNSCQMPSKLVITKSVLDALSEFDRICVWTHRMIVSTEYCMKCKCKYYTQPAIQFRKM